MHDNVNMLLKRIKISRPRTKIADQIQWKCIVTKWSNYAVSNKHVISICLKSWCTLNQFI